MRPIFQSFHSDPFTRGGQIFTHQWRMRYQNFKVVAILGIACGLLGIWLKSSQENISLWLLWDFYTLSYLGGKIKMFVWPGLQKYLLIDIDIFLRSLLRGTKGIPSAYKKLSQLTTDLWVPGRGHIHIRTFKFLKNPWVLKEAARVHAILLWGLGSWALGMAAMIWGFCYRSRRVDQNHFLRGNKMASVTSLARRLKWTFKASDLKLGNLPLVKDTEKRHILISGTTGSGKSNAFHTLLPQIRKRGDSAIVIDVEGTFTSHYFREGQDILLNPFDIRSDHWDLWGELESEPIYEVFAQAAVPPIKEATDPIWGNASRTVLVAALLRLREQGQMSVSKLYERIALADPKEFEEFFKGTEAATYSQEKGERFTSSVRGSLLQHIKFFKYLPEYRGGRKISLRQWIRSEPRDQWLFITVKQDWFKVMKPLISAWMDLATSSVLSLDESETRRLWFILDELPALHALPCMKDNLSRTRKFGGCVMAGVQSFDQLEETYGRLGSKILLNLFNTKVFFRNEEPGSTEWISRLLGEKEEKEISENLSYGANTMRDGVSLNQQTKTTRLVIPTEIGMLRDLEAFVKLPGEYPITRLRLPFTKPNRIAEGFEPRPEEMLIAKEIPSQSDGQQE